MKKYIAIAGWLLITACGVKTRLSKDDLQWVNYQPDDTLIFKSNRGNFDTIVITERSVYYPDYNPIELHDKYHPQMATIKAKRPGTEAFTFVELEKRKPNEVANWGIEIRFPGFFSKKSDKIKVVSSKLHFEYNNVYQLSQNDNDIERFSSSETLFVARLYLTLNYKLLAYEMSDGELFERLDGQ